VDSNHRGIDGKGYVPNDGGTSDRRETLGEKEWEENMIKGGATERLL